VKPTTRNSIASFLSAAGSLLSALASEFDSTEPADNTPAPAPTPKPRAKKETGTPAAAAAEETTGGKTYEELKALIEPLVKDGQGPAVKKLIAKYDPSGNPPSIKTMPAANHAAFEKDLAALGY
jgi:hypothetical protein